MPVLLLPRSCEWFALHPIAGGEPGAKRFRILEQMSQRFLSKVNDGGTYPHRFKWDHPSTCQEKRCWPVTEERILHPLCGTEWICLAVMNSGRILGFSKDWSTCCLPSCSVAWHSYWPGHQLGLRVIGWGYHMSGLSHNMFLKSPLS